MKKLLSLLLVSFMFIIGGCKEEILLPEMIQGTDGTDGTDGISSIFGFDVIAPTPEHTNGGVLLMIGGDLNGNQTLDEDEVQVSFPIWHGNDGADGLDGINGSDGSVVTIGEDGYWYIDGVKTDVKALGEDGVDGTDGVDGKSPYIGEDGYWYVWDSVSETYVSTNIKAEGKDGVDGLTPNIVFINNPVPPTPEYTNGGILVMAVWDKNFDEEITDDEIIGMYTVWHGNDGADGLTPYIVDGYWWIGEYNTQIKAIGIDGEDGVDGLTPEIIEGYWYIGGFNTGVKAEGIDGEDGADGIDGLTPYIGENGNWWIGGFDTEVQAQGPAGQDGMDGANGADGVSPHIGDNGNWFIGETDTGIQAEGVDGRNGRNGKTPYIGENGNWFIGRRDTGVNAEGVDGEDGKSPFIGIDLYWYVWDDVTGSYINTGVYSVGAQGEDGEDGQDGNTPYIGDNGNWWIANFDTGVRAEGVDGEDGEDGFTPYIGENGNWFINGRDTGVRAEGRDGQDGADGSVVTFELTQATEECENGGYIVTALIDGETSYTFTICNGVDGEDGENGQDGEDATCEDAYVVIDNQTLINDTFDNERLSNGYLYNLTAYTFIADKGVVKLSRYNNDDAFIYVDDVNSNNVTHISVDLKEHKSNYNKYVKASVVYDNGSILHLSEYEIKGDEKTYEWSVNTTSDVVAIKFYFRDNVPTDTWGSDGNHNNRKIVVDNIVVTGSKKIYVQCDNEELN